MLNGQGRDSLGIFSMRRSRNDLSPRKEIITCSEFFLGLILVFGKGLITSSRRFIHVRTSSVHAVLLIPLIFVGDTQGYTMTSADELPVDLYVYDLSRGLARTMSLALLGQQIDGIWHTAIVYNGREYFFGREGILDCPPGGTILGQPTQILHLGVTEIPKGVVDQHIQELGSTTFRGDTYDLFYHNCNNFSHELAQFLTGNGVPLFILSLPHEVASTPLGAIIRQFAQSSLLVRQQRSYEPNPLEILIRERVLHAGGIRMGDNVGSDSDEGAPVPVIRKRDVVAEVEEEERKEREEKKKNREPPIVFRELGHTAEELLDELEKSLGDDGSWVLSEDFLNLIGRILLSGEDGIGDNSRTYLMKVLSWLAVTKDDVILVLHQDRKDHVIMRYASNIDQLSPACQEAVAILICNLFENLSTSEWLLYISEWDMEGRGQTSNIRVTTKVGVHALLSKDFKDVGSALVYNMLAKEVKTAVFDDVAVEMALALLQFLSEKPAETLTWRGLKSLLRCCQLARAEVPSLVKMVGPSPSELKGISARCDELVQLIEAILSTA
ncbi:unnamed protein product [Allacma fusca]|uniref:PPPDE domain-containing protein n=1 Tax=Allacma fusca TaxID=39272 RepID=A0A8J2JU58_9HEXA|nr:unnamed protein product [Allacma fusca]